MIKKVKIIIAVVVILALVLGGVWLYFRGTPEYALLCILNDVEDDGIKGLEPHLTGRAKEVLDSITSKGDSGWVDLIIQYASRSEYVAILKEKMQEIEWDVEDILKGKKNTTVILSFNYHDKITGTIDLSMIKVRGEWKIDGLGFPKFWD